MNRKWHRLSLSLSNLYSNSQWKTKIKTIWWLTFKRWYFQSDTIWLSCHLCFIVMNLFKYMCVFVVCAWLFACKISFEQNFSNRICKIRSGENKNNPSKKITLYWISPSYNMWKTLFESIHSNHLQAKNNLFVGTQVQVKRNRSKIWTISCSVIPTAHRPLINRYLSVHCPVHLLHNFLYGFSLLVSSILYTSEIFYNTFK